MELLKAETAGAAPLDSEAGLGGADDVAVHSCPIMIDGEEPAIKLKGGRLLCS
jgi:hypothetical protein